MSTVNKVIIVGNMVENIQVKEMSNGVKIATFTLVTNHRYKGGDGEMKEEAEFHNCVAYRGIAELLEQYGRKGQKNYVEGRLRTRSWEDENGQKRYKTEIVVENFTMLSKKES